MFKWVPGAIFAQGVEFVCPESSGSWYGNATGVFSFIYDNEPGMLLCVYISDWDDITWSHPFSKLGETLHTSQYRK